MRLKEEIRNAQKQAEGTAEEGKRLKNVSQGMGRLERVKLLSSVPGCLGRVLVCARSL